MIDLRTRPVTESYANLNWKCPATKSHPEGPFYCEGSTCPWWRWHKDGTSTVQESGVGYCGGGGPL